MLKKLSLAVASTLPVILINFTSYADTISGELTFLKRPASTGILFVQGRYNEEKEAIVDQKDKAFTEKIIVASPKGKITFKNSDEFDHNIYISDDTHNVHVDVGLMTPGNETNLPVDWNQNTLVRLRCKIHPRMSTYVANIDSSNFHTFSFDKKKKSYQFAIDKVPTTHSVLQLLIPKYDQSTFKLNKGEKKSIEITRKGKVKAILTIERT